MSEKIHSFLEHKIKPYANMYAPLILLVIVTAQTLLTFFAIKIHFSVWTSVFALTCVSVCIYVFCIQYMEDFAKAFTWLLKCSISLFAAALASAPFVALVSKVTDSGGRAGAMETMSLVFAAAGFVGGLFFFTTEKGTAIIEKLDQLISLQKKEEDKVKPGSVVICRNLDKLKELFPNVKDEQKLLEKCLDTELVERELKRKKINCDEIIPYEDRFLHQLVIGPTGCGKTSQILIPMILQDIQNKEMGITVLDPKGDFAQKIYMMGKYFGRTDIFYFDPTLHDCPHFNPLSGKESDVVENIAMTFRMMTPDSPTFFLDQNEQLMRNAVKVLKRLDADQGVEGANANLIKLSQLLQNSGGAGHAIIKDFVKVSSPTPEEAKENLDIASWFQNDYFAERSKLYENTSEVRSQVAKLTSNPYLREVLNPDPTKGEKNDIDFDRLLAEGGVCCISTAQGTLRGLSKFLGYFLILQLQSCVFRRPGNEDTRRPHMLYIDEFQTYSTPGFGDMLTQGRSYRVASILATQARTQMEMGAGRDGRSFVNLVSTNARNMILFPGCNNDDTEYYSKNFGEYEKVEEMVGVSKKKWSLIRGGLSPLGYDTESIREQKKMTANFSSSELRFQPNRIITYCIVQNKSVQPARQGVVSYIPYELNKKLNQMVADYLEEHAWDAEKEGISDKFQVPDFDGSTAAVIPESEENADILNFNDDLEDQIAKRAMPEEPEILIQEPELESEDRNLDLGLENLDDDYGDPFDGM